MYPQRAFRACGLVKVVAFTSCPNSADSCDSLNTLGFETLVTASAAFPLVTFVTTFAAIIAVPLKDIFPLFE
jgi:hypothetical protein